MNNGWQRKCPSVLFGFDDFDDVWLEYCLVWFGLVWFVEAALSGGRMTNFHQFADKHRLGNALIG